MVIPFPLRFALDSLPDGLKDERTKECPGHGSDDEVLVGRLLEQGFYAKFIEPGKKRRVPEGAEGSEPPLSGPNIVGRPEIGMTNIVDIPVILVPDRMLHILPPAL